MFSRLLLLLFLATVVLNTDYQLASFNVQVFGLTKMADRTVVSTLVKIFRRYDILFMMEIRDSTQTAVYELLDEVNYRLPESNRYKMVVSERFGRGASKEQYAFFYKPSMVEITEVIQYQDPTYAEFQRPPYGILVNLTSSSNAEPYSIFLMGLHDSPLNATQEIENFAGVYEFLVEDPSLPISEREVIKSRSIFMGDLNAGCKYVSHKRLVECRDRWAKDDMVWLIPDTADTMVATDCPYDRFITQDGYKDLTDIGPFYYDKEWGLSQALAANVSDHYPIQLTIKVP